MADVKTLPLIFTGLVPILPLALRWRSLLNKQNSPVQFYPPPPYWSHKIGFCIIYIKIPLRTFDLPGAPRMAPSQNDASCRNLLMRESFRWDQVKTGTNHVAGNNRPSPSRVNQVP